MKKKIGIYGFTGCAGDQLTIIHSEDKLLSLFDKAEIVSFSMAKSDNKECELDIAFIEGSITTEEQKKRLIEIRNRTDILVPIGTCACFGGIQSMKLGDGKYMDRYRKVYGNNKITIDKAFESLPL
ncbi:sulfhydrogenase 1 subunit delta, partial [candidate division WOR-3 bacterium]|nr:sulfhydrogenase 1 subunit delta [candidate division WOR-3 bacterium]